MKSYQAAHAGIIMNSYKENSLVRLLDDTMDAPGRVAYAFASLNDKQRGTDAWSLMSDGHGP